MKLTPQQELIEAEALLEEYRKEILKGSKGVLIEGNIEKFEKQLNKVKGITYRILCIKEALVINGE